MTLNGVIGEPILRYYDMGVAMVNYGTDVFWESYEIFISNDNFSTILYL